MTNSTLKVALLAYAEEFEGQDGAMDPDHGSDLGQAVCEQLGTADWHAEFGSVSLTEGSVEFFLKNGGHYSVRTDVQEVA